MRRKKAYYGDIEFVKGANEGSGMKCRGDKDIGRVEDERVGIVVIMRVRVHCTAIISAEREERN